MQLHVRPTSILFQSNAIHTLHEKKIGADIFLYPLLERTISIFPLQLPLFSNPSFDQPSIAEPLYIFINHGSAVYLFIFLTMVLVISVLGSWLQEHPY